MRATLAVVAATLLAGPALAQDYPSQNRSSSAPGYERPEQRERPEAAEQDPSQDLVRQLNLRSDQQAAFRDYQAAFQADSQTDDADGGADIARLAAMTTPQRLDDEARRMDQDRAAFERISAATRRFYASLDSIQRRTFDRITAPREDADDGPDGDDRQGPPPSDRSDPSPR